MSFIPFKTCWLEKFIKMNLQMMFKNGLLTFPMCSVNREIMHTGHTLCWLSPKMHLSYPDMSAFLNLSVHC